MHIVRLHINRYRGVRSLSIELKSRLNVFVGVNGAGKSTIMDSVAILSSWLVNRIKSPNASGRTIAETDICNGESSAALRIECEDNGESFGWTLVKSRKGYIKKEISSDLIQLTDFTKKVNGEIEKNSGKLNLPVFIYYPVNRAVLDIPLRIRERHSFDLLSAYDESLTSGANFRTFFEWFREREDLENEALRDQSSIPGIVHDSQYPDPHLTAVRKALEKFIPEFTDLTVRRNPLRMEVKKNGFSLTVNQLSDGEKCLIALVGDLARRMAIANPVGQNPLNGDGVVLIDEIDLHLHPKWQKMVLPKLLEVFPNCQFLVSTHSPSILTYVHSEHLFLMSLSTDGIKVSNPHESYGKNVDRILEDLMGVETTRVEEVAQSIKGIYTDIEAGKLDDAMNSISKLRNEIGEDPDLVKASVLIKRKELIGK